jgi:peroxiredoxin
MSNLNEELCQLHKHNLEANKEVTQLIDYFNSTLNLSNVLKESNKIPDFDLLNVDGKKVSIKDYLGKGPLVLFFYRGGWCHYCCKELQMLQKYNSQINKLGARLIGICPQVKDFTIKTKHDNGVEFDLLIDENAECAKKFGIVFDVPQDIYNALSNFADLKLYYGEYAAHKIVLPGTFIVDSKGIIIHKFVTTDYSKRLEPSEIVEILKTSSKVESS